MNTPRDKIAKYAQMNEDEQFAAVAWGEKPICVIMKKHETNLPHFEIETTVNYTLNGTAQSYSYPEYVYYKRGLGAEAKRVAELIGKDKTKKEHKELGLLLGYTKEEVEAWTKRVIEQ